MSRSQSAFSVHSGKLVKTSSTANRRVAQQNQHAIMNNAQQFNDFYFSNLATEVIETTENNDDFNRYMAMLGDPKVAAIQIADGNQQISDADAEVIYNAIPEQARKYTPPRSSANYKPYIYLLVIALLMTSIEYVDGRRIRRGQCEYHRKNKFGKRVCGKYKPGGGHKKGNKGGDARKSRKFSRSRKLRLSRRCH